MWINKNSITFKNNYFALRHGQSEANVQGIIVSDPKIGCSEYGLTDTGRAQVRNSISGFQILDDRAIIITSDFLRARETADIAAGILGVKENIIFAEELRERDFGRFNLESSDNYKVVWSCDSQGKVCFSVEPPLSVLNRIQKLVCRLEKNYSGTKILFVSHGDALQIFAAGIKGISPNNHRDVEHFQTGEIRLLV